MTDYIHDQALLVNTPVQAESLLHSLQQEGIGFYMNASKTEFTCFKQRVISPLSSKLLKLIDQFTST